MNNEKGVILPMTVMLSFLILLIFSQQLELFLSEKQFVAEVEKINQLENLMQLSVHDISNDLSAIEMLDSPFYGRLTYPIGQTQYSLTPESADITRVVITCKEAGGRQYKAQLYYSFESDKIIKWFEYR